MNWNLNATKDDIYRYEAGKVLFPVLVVDSDDKMIVAYELDADMLRCEMGKAIGHYIHYQILKEDLQSSEFLKDKEIE